MAPFVGVGERDAAFVLDADASSVIGLVSGAAASRVHEIRTKLQRFSSKIGGLLLQRRDNGHVMLLDTDLFLTIQFSKKPV